MQKQIIYRPEKRKPYQWWTVPFSIGAILLMAFKQKIVQGIGSSSWSVLYASVVFLYIALVFYAERKNGTGAATLKSFLLLAAVIAVVALIGYVIS